MMSSLSPAQQLRLDLYRERFAIDPATALDGAIAAYNWIVGPAPEMVRIVEIDPATLSLFKKARSETAVTLLPGEDVQPPAEQRPWTEDEETELERLSAAGLGYKEISERLGRSLQGVNMRASETGITRRWPRGPGGTLKFTPHPLSAPWPPVERAAASPTPPRRQALKNAEIDQFRALCAEGLEPREIEARFGWARNGAHSRAGRLGFSAMWREARERRRAEPQAEPKPEPEPASVQEEASAPPPKPKKNSLFNARQRALVESADPDWQKNADAGTLKMLLDAGKTLVDIAEIVHAPSWHVVRDLAAKHGLLARTANGRWTRPASQSAVAEGSAPQVKERKCLRCGTSFPSEGPGNRLCGTCRDAVSGEYDPWGGK